MAIPQDSIYQTAIRHYALVFALGLPLTVLAVLTIDQRVVEAVGAAGHWDTSRWIVIRQLGAWEEAISVASALAALALIGSLILPLARRVLSDWAVWAAVTVLVLVVQRGCVGCAKLLLGRAGPGGDPFAFFLYGPPYMAMPSGHAATAFAVATMIALRWPRVAVSALSVATLVALAQVLLLAHWFSDVIVGGLIGSGVAIAAWGVLEHCRASGFGSRRAKEA